MIMKTLIWVHVNIDIWCVPMSSSAVGAMRCWDNLYMINVISKIKTCTTSYRQNYSIKCSSTQKKQTTKKHSALFIFTRNIFFVAISYRRTLQGRGQELLTKLKQAGVGRRPIVWVGHSMGGEVLNDNL